MSASLQPRRRSTRLASWAAALFCLVAAPQSFACAGALPVSVAFARGESQLSAVERAKLEAGVRKARAQPGGGELKVALEIYSQGAEAGSDPELNRLTERRVRALRDAFAAFGLDPAAVIAVRGDAASLPPSAGAGGSAEIEIAYACQAS